MGVFFPDLIPVLWIDIAALILVITITFAVVRLLRRWHRSSIPNVLLQNIRKMPATKSLRILLKTAMVDGLAIYPLWRKSKARWLGHALVYYGFLGLMLTTTLDSLFNPEAHPLELTNPIKILGNVSGVSVLIGVPIMLEVKGESKEDLGLGDKIFLPALILTVVTGFITEAFSLSDAVFPAYAAYVIHLILAVLLLGSAPFTRFMHAILAPYLILFDNYGIQLADKGDVRQYKQDLIVKDLTMIMERREPHGQ